MPKKKNTSKTRGPKKAVKKNKGRSPAKKTAGRTKSLRGTGRSSRSGGILKPLENVLSAFADRR